VATPLGNLRDITLRALDTLGHVDIIACEDTRRTGKLLKQYEITKRLISLHAFNESRRTHEVTDTLLDGGDVALVSDAGTPMLSDPGEYLVKECVRRGIPIVPVPGPSALTTALSISHLTVGSFFFCGFAPSRRGQRVRFLRTVADLPWSTVFYEAPHRIIALLEDLLEIFGDRQCLVCRELTKLYEEILRGRISAILHQLKDRERIRGELTLVVGPPETDMPYTDADNKVEEITSCYKKLKTEGLTRKEILDLLGQQFGLSRNRLYKMLLEKDKQNNERS